MVAKAALLPLAPIGHVPCSKFTRSAGGHAKIRTVATKKPGPASAEQLNAGHPPVGDGVAAKARATAMRPLTSLRIRAVPGSGAPSTAYHDPVRFGPLLGAPHPLVGRRPVAAVDGEIVITHADALVARHLAVARGEASIQDDHYGGARSHPVRGVLAGDPPMCAEGLVVPPP